MGNMTQMPADTSALEFDQIDYLVKSMRVSGHTALSLADAIGVHRNTIRNYLTGRTKLDRRTLIAWAFATGVPVEWLDKPSPTTPPGGGAAGHSGFGTTRG